MTTTPRILPGPGPLRFWHDFLADKHGDIGAIVEFSTVPASRLSLRALGKRVYTIASVCAGDADEGEGALQPLRERGSMVADFSGQMDYCNVQKLFDARRSSASLSATRS